MKRTSLISIVAFMLMITVVAGVLASASGMPSDDSYVDNATSAVGNHDTQTLKIAASKVGDNCNPTRTVYLKWSLADLGLNPAVQNKTVDSATLTLTLTNLTSQAAGREVTLFRVANDTWTEETVACGDVNCTQAPLVGTAIQAVNLSATPTQGEAIVFNNAALVSYINEQSTWTGEGDLVAGDNVASFAVRLTTCSTSSTQGFADKESTTGQPTLLMENPTAVAVSDLSADNSTTAWPLYAGLGAVALILVAGLAISRRRTA